MGGREVSLVYRMSFMTARTAILRNPTLGRKGDRSRPRRQVKVTSRQTFIKFAVNLSYRKPYLKGKKQSKRKDGKLTLWKEI